MFALHSAITFRGQFAFPDLNILPGVQHEFYLHSESMTKDLGEKMMFHLCGGAKLAGIQSQ